MKTDPSEPYKCCAILNAATPHEYSFLFLYNHHSIQQKRVEHSNGIINMFKYCNKIYLEIQHIKIVTITFLSEEWKSDSADFARTVNESSIGKCHMRITNQNFPLYFRNLKTIKCNGQLKYIQNHDAGWHSVNINLIIQKHLKVSVLLCAHNEQNQMC